MKFYLTILLSTLTAFSYAENDTIYFTDYWRLCEIEEAQFYRVYNKEKDNYLINDYYIGGQVQMSTFSSDYVKLNKNGITTFYFKSGQKEKEGNYVDNEREGEWKMWLENGQLEEVGNFKNEKRVGAWKGYYEEGAIDYEEFYNDEGKLEGEAKYWYENGKIYKQGSYKKDEKFGEWEGFHENGIKLFKREYDTEGEIHGESTIWHDNEQLSSKKEYSNGKIVKGGETFHENGKVNLEYNYTSKGEKEGDWIQYFPNGKIQISGQFKSDEKDGDWIENHEDNVGIKISGSYKKGVKKGEWKYYGLNEVVLALIDYKEGSIKSEKYLDAKGRKVKSKDANRDPFFKSMESNSLSDQLNLNLELKNDVVVPGNAVISMNIAEDGTILKVYCAESINPKIDSALVVAFRKLKKFKPGKKYNSKVKYYCDFELKLNANNTLELKGEHYISSAYSDIDFENYSYDDAIFTIVESMPEYPGGIKNLFVFLGENVKYPQSAKANGISGKVYVNFTVRRTGLISNIKIIRGVHKILDFEALRVVNELPKWTPGYQRGHPVSVSYNLPINFVLR